MDNLQVFHDPILGVRVEEDTLKYWNQCYDQFEAGKFKDSILNLLNYINPEIIKKGKKSENEFFMPHGSVNITLGIDGGNYTIDAPFLKMPEKKRIPIMRQLSEINFNILVLSQIGLKDNQLNFHFQAPIEQCDPYKLYDTLQEICINADYYDDFFISKFQAEALHEPEAQPFDDKTLEDAWQKFQSYLGECEEYVKYFDGKRFFNASWEALITCAFKIDYTLAPQGMLVVDVTNWISELQSNRDLMEVLAKAKDTLKKLQSYDKDKFAESMYIPQYLIHPKKRASVAYIHDFFEPDFDRAKLEMSNSNFSAVATRLAYDIFYLYFYNKVPSKVEKVLNKGLAKASGQKLKQAAEALYNAIGEVMKIPGENR